MILLEAAPTSVVERCDSTVFRARQRDVYLELFRECDLELRALTGVDPAPFRTRLLPYLRKLPRAVSWVCWFFRQHCPCPSMRCLVAAPSTSPGMRCSCSNQNRGKLIMALKRRSVIAIGVFVLLAVVVAAGHWYETQAGAAGQHVGKRRARCTSPTRVTGDPAPCARRCSSSRVPPVPAPSRIEIPAIKLETALPALVSGRGVKLVGQATGTVIDAQALNAGPVFDVSGPNTSIEEITISKCPAAAILVRSVHFRLSATTIESCDVGVEVAENASDTLLERNHFTKNRVGIRFAASGHNTAVANNEFKEEQGRGPVGGAQRAGFAR